MKIKRNLVFFGLIVELTRSESVKAGSYLDSPLIGGALQTAFVGDRAAGLFPAPSPRPASFTIEGYFYAPAEPIPDHTIFLFARGDFAAVAISKSSGSIWIPDPAYQVFLLLPDGNPGELFGSDVGGPWGDVAGGWHHLACVSNGGQTQVYLDGKPIYPFFLSSFFWYTPGPGLGIIGSPWVPGAYQGYFWDEVRVSSIARYTKSFAPPRNPFERDAATLGLWHFDEPAGSRVFADTSGNDLTLYAANGAATVAVGLHLQIALIGGSAAQLALFGPTGHTYRVESSPDLSAWTAMTTVAPTQSPTYILDTNIASSTKFYRAVAQ